MVDELHHALSTLFKRFVIKYVQLRYVNQTNFEIPSKVEKILKGSLDSISLPSLSVKIQIMDGKVCLITSSKLSRQLFEFSLKVKVMRSNPGYLLKSFLL